MTWDEFKALPQWREIVATVRERQRMILSNLVNADVCKDIPSLSGLQAEYATCEWFIQFPTIPVDATEKSDEEV